MRLPVVTREHAIHEDARQHNELLYAAFLAGQKVDVPVTPDTVHQIQLKQSGDYRRFWLARGFRIRTKRNAEATILAVWLERVDGPAIARGKSLAFSRSSTENIGVFAVDGPIVARGSIS